MQMYITDKSAKQFFRTSVSAAYASGERNNLQHRLALAQRKTPGYEFIDAETARLVEISDEPEMTDDELLADLLA